IWDALAGLPGWPGGCEPDHRPCPPWGLDRWLTDPAVRAAGAAVEQREAVVAVAASDRPDAFAARLAALVAMAGSEASVLHAPALDGRLAASILLLTLIRGTVPIVWSEHAPAGPISCVDVPGPLLLALPTTGVKSWSRPLLPVPSGPLGRLERVAAAQAALPELGALRYPIGPATLEPGELAMAAADLRARARLSGWPFDRDDLTEAIDTRTAAAVPPGAVLVHPAASWEDLVLPDDRVRQLREAVERVHGQRIVFEQWGFLRGRTGRRGLRLLFCGPPGTGKTLAAEVIAGELGRDLLVVDLSRMVSKWIGETEKNLAAAFEAAERGGAALLFDEADALFGKRTEVGDARDRYANLETAYLLSRLERFDGVAILATNLRQNLDTAFARRLEFIVSFDLPTTAERELLWRCHLPPGAPLAPSVDLARLAALYELSGALIRNAAVAAAFLAAAEAAGSPGGTHVPITPRHLVHAVRREYVKAGQAFPGPPAGVKA
ncbi:MAG: ATP-binding protein, partial [Egibacteraceae bacterium]